MIDNFAIVLCIDSNKKYVDEKNQIQTHYYEYETLKCIESWRLNGGRLSNCPIYLVDFYNSISSETIRYYLSLKNIFLIDAYKCKLKNIKNHLFLNTLYAQYIIENFQVIKEQFILQLDLDMYLKKEIPISLIQSNSFIIGEYKKSDFLSKELEYRISNIEKLKSPIHNSYFILYDKTNRYFSNLYDLLQTNQYEDFFNKFIKYKDDDYFYEEGIYDFNFILNKEKFNFNYKTVDSFFINTFFDHHHLLQKETIPYVQRLVKYR